MSSLDFVANYRTILRSLEAERNAKCPYDTPKHKKVWEAEHRACLATLTELLMRCKVQ